MDLVSPPVTPRPAGGGDDAVLQITAGEIVSPCDVDLTGWRDDEEVCAPNWITAATVADAVRAFEYLWQFRDRWIRLFHQGRLETAYRRAQRYMEPSA